MNTAPPPPHVPSPFDSPTTRDRLTAWWAAQQPRLDAVCVLITRDNWLAVPFAIGGLALTAGMLYVAYLVIDGLFGWLADVGVRAGDRIVAGGNSVADWPVLQVAVDPIRNYLAEHAAGLPATANELWATWLVVAGVLLVLSWFGSWGARLGWILTGAAGVAMAWAGSPEASQTLSAGVTTLAWAMLSVLAFAGVGRSRLPRLVVNNIPVDPVPEPAPAPAERTIHRPSRFSQA